MDENACPSCQEAKRIYDKARKELPAKQVRQRDSSRAQAYANKRLKAAHPEEYLSYYREEKDKLREEMK